MTLNNIKDLEKLIKLMKKHGVRAIKVDNVEFTLDAQVTSYQPDLELPLDAKLKVPAYNGAASLEPDKIETEELTEEQLLFYSAKPEPGAEAEQ